MSEASRVTNRTPVHDVLDPGQQREEALAVYGVLFDAPQRELQALVDIAAQVCAVPRAAINIITSTQQQQIATTGFAASICAREDSMCAAVLDDTDRVVVPDASLDDRFRENPFVTGILGTVRFYASAPLTDAGRRHHRPSVRLRLAAAGAGRGPGGGARRDRRACRRRARAAPADPRAGGLPRCPDPDEGRAAPLQRGTVGLRRPGQPRPAHPAHRDHGQHRDARPAARRRR